MRCSPVVMEEIMAASGVDTAVVVDGSTEESPKLVEPVAVRVKSRLPAQVSFANEARGIPCRLEQTRERCRRGHESARGIAGL